MKTSKHIKAIMVTAIFCCIACNTYAQKETELFIPIGQSPGVSGKFSVMGRLGSVTTRDSTMALGMPSGLILSKMNAQTKIYLDRSKLKLTNIKGTPADIKPGMMVEIKYVDNRRGGLIEWIKVQIEKI
jgi:hypothetical protein